MITDDEARRIAQNWHSPSPHDRALTQLSHGLPYALGDLALVVERHLREHPGKEDLKALMVWVSEKCRTSTCPACRGEHDDHTLPGGCHSENCPCGHPHDAEPDREPSVADEEGWDAREEWLRGD